MRHGCTSLSIGRRITPKKNGYRSGESAELTFVRLPPPVRGLSLNDLVDLVDLVVIADFVGLVGLVILVGLVDLVDLVV